ncbi:MAG: PLP-dependent cysteine synthase family protein [bacterium]
MTVIFKAPASGKKKEAAAAIEKNNLLNRIGKTPLLALPRISKAVWPVKIYAKAEWFNPGGSVKDRAALNMILEGVNSGGLTRSQTILDATSGNTGIAYAMIGAALGYKVRLCLPSNAGALFKQILHAYGAELIYTDPQEGSDGAILAARKMYQENPENYFYPDQYNSRANWMAHYQGTAVEIYQQTQGKITHFVAGLGTSGTFMGAGRRLKMFRHDVQLISVQPDSPFHGLEGLKHISSSIQPGIYDHKLADTNLEVRTEDAQIMVKRLAREEGLLVGLSSGANLAAALTVAEQSANGLIVVIFPDSAHKYFDQRFWREFEYGH